MNNSKTLKTSAIGVLGFFGAAMFLCASGSVPASEPKAELQAKVKEAHDVGQINRAIAKLSSKLEDADRKAIARSIYKASKQHNVNPKLMVAILMQESSFDQRKVSRTGDISISQINYSVWSKEFSRLKKAPLDRFRLQVDRDYAIFRMAEILEILSKQKQRDKYWYATYHSRTLQNKFIYVAGVNRHLNKIADL